MDYATKYLGKVVTIKMDRPIGTEHPKHPGLIYPINYGFVPGNFSPDGEETDAYILGITEPLTEFTGVCIAVIHRTNDADDKLIVVPEGTSFTDEQIKELTYFQEKYYQSEIIRSW
ncbi:MAG: inorganic diphosphatase [Patescibacteria group bacterium]|jgi:inorganic pyrophosphatase